MIAFADGKPVQWRYSSSEADWDDNTASVPSWDLDSYEYRPKPEPKTRLWNRPEDVPGPVCWIRGVGDYRMAMIVGFAGENAYITISCGCLPIAISHQFSDTQWGSMEYSIDRLTWHKCEVVEEA